MTGYARAEGRAIVGPTEQAWAWVWELKSVNARGLDIRFRLPGGTERLESGFRKAIASRVSRGSVTAQLILRPEDGEGKAGRINRPLLKSIAGLGQELAGTGIGMDTRLRLDTLLTIRGVVDLEPPDIEDEGVRREVDDHAVRGLTCALEQLREMRAAEGRGLHDLLSGQLDVLEQLGRRAASAAEDQIDSLRDRLRSQVSLLLDSSSPLPEDRLAQELALLVTRADIREEIERLAIHLDACRTLLNSNGPVGRRLDFLCQELNREANTICSKAVDIPLTRTGLDLKSAIEQFREQVQNVE